MMHKHTDLSLRTLRRVAVAADADVRTVAKIAIGVKVRGTVAERIAEELRRAGISVPALGTADQIEAQQPVIAGGGS